MTTRKKREKTWNGSEEALEVVELAQEVASGTRTALNFQVGVNLRLWGGAKKYGNATTRLIGCKTGQACLSKPFDNAGSVES